MKLKIITVSLLFITALSCRKENITIAENTDASLLTKIRITNQPFYEFIYNGANLVTAENSKYIFTLHRYNDNNQLLATDYYGDNALMSTDSLTAVRALNRKEWVTSANTPKGATLTYEYNVNGQLSGTTFSLPSGTNLEYTEFTYDDNNRIGKQTLYWGDKLSGYINFLYDANGNLIKETLYTVSSKGIAELSTTTQFEFDNYQNPFRSFSRLVAPGINTNRNNITKEIVTIHFKPGQGPDLVQTSVFSYIYNSNGYPIRKNSTLEYVY